jgi:hypothetical protein
MVPGIRLYRCALDFGADFADITRQGELDRHHAEQHGERIGGGQAMRRSDFGDALRRNGDGGADKSEAHDGGRNRLGLSMSVRMIPVRGLDGEPEAKCYDARTDDVAQGYRDFLGWEMPWYSALGSLETLLVGRRVGRMHLVCYLRQGSKVFETCWTTSRGVEYMDNNYRLLDLIVYGQQERFEDSPDGWPQPPKGTDTMRADGRPLAQWPRLKAGYSDDLGTSTR